MYRALALLALPALLLACAAPPAVDAAAPAQIAPQPAYLTPTELAAVNARLKVPLPALDDRAGDALRSRADDLRSR